MITVGRSRWFTKPNIRSYKLVFFARRYGGTWFTKCEPSKNDCTYSMICMNKATLYAGYNGHANVPTLCVFMGVLIL